jgi:hypothetical protein
MSTHRRRLAEGATIMGMGEKECMTERESRRRVEGVSMPVGRLYLGV